MSKLLPMTHNVCATCPECHTVTSFEHKQSLVVTKQHQSVSGRTFPRKVYVLSQCASCGLGGFADISDNGNAYDAQLNDFYPVSIDAATLPLEFR